MATSNSTRVINPFLHLKHAQTVAHGLRDAAEACTPDQPVLKARLVTAACCIDVLVELLLTAIVRKGLVRNARGEVRQ